MKRLLIFSVCIGTSLIPAPAATTYSGAGTDTPVALIGGASTQTTGGNPGGYLQITDAINSQNAAAGFDRTDVGTYPQSLFSFDFRIEPLVTNSADGISFVYLPTSSNGNSGAGPTFGESPTAAGTLGFTFDTWSNNGNVAGGDPNDDPNQPQGSDYQEISIFWNGAVVPGGANYNTRLLPTPLFLDDAAWHRVTGSVNFQTARVGISVDGQSIFNNLAVPGLTPYESRISFTGRTGGENERASIDNLNVTWVPEPGVATLTLLGLGLLARRRRA